MTGHLHRLCATLRTQVPSGIGIGVADPSAPSTNLDPVEIAATGRMIDRRLREFAAGRKAARRAMADIGVPVAPVPAGADRAPQWPTGLSGSISHCATAALAVTARHPQTRSLGIDIEDAAPLDLDLWDDILTERERAQVPDGLTAKRIFCAKEAAFKAQYPLTHRMLDFKDVEVALDGADFVAHVRDARHGDVSALAGRVFASDRYIISLVIVQ